MEQLVSTNQDINVERKFPKESIKISFTEGPLGLGYGMISAVDSSSETSERRAENMTNFFCEVKADSPSDCIDGRQSLGLLNGSSLEAPRPGVAGGASVTGYAAAELVDYFHGDKKSVAGKYRMIIERLEDTTGGAPTILTGGHLDNDAVENNFSEGKTGCGAADKFVENMALLSRNKITFQHTDGSQKIESDEEVHSRLSAIKGLTSLVLEKSGYYSGIDSELLLEQIFNRATQIHDQSALNGWSGVIMKDNLEQIGRDRLVVLDTSAGGVHGHTEKKVLFNFVNKSTFDQDKYFSSTRENEGEGREIFDVDVWHIRDIANKLANSPDEEQASKLFASGVAFQIATYLGLCDGSHRAFFAEAK